MINTVEELIKKIKRDNTNDMLVDEIVEYYKKANIYNIQKRIEKFKNIPIEKLTEKKLRKEIYKVLLNEKKFHYISNNAVYPKGTKYFRVRKLDRENPLATFSAYSDFWEPPKHFVTKEGRLNKVQESLLYTTPGNAAVPIKEMKISDGEIFMLIEYTSKTDVKVNIIGGDYDYKKLKINNKKAIEGHELYNNFLLSEFSCEVKEGEEYIYKISEFIAKDFFDLPPRVVQDAWAYKSIKDNKSYNVCFRPEIAHDILSLKGGMVCKLTNEENKLSVVCVAIWNNNKIEYHPIDSEIAKSVFPEIISNM